MAQSARSRVTPAAILALVAGLALAAVCTLLFPEVEGLGAKVRLPVFHGAMTWVNLAAFSLMGVGALAFLATGRQSLYRITAGVRYVAAGMWLLGSGLGLLAALETWDFTGSRSAPIEVAMQDPRLTAQFWIVLMVLALVALVWLFDDRRWLAGADVAFTVGMWTILLRAILGPGRALHPDSPVMNSDEMIIRAMFLGIVAGLFIAMAAGSWIVSRWVSDRPPAGEITDA